MTARARYRTTPTVRDLEVLAFVLRHLGTWGCAPTRVEIGVALGISAPTAQGHLQALQQCGLVELQSRWRGIEITRKGRTTQ